MFGTGLGFGEIVLILLVALIIFGPAKLPELGRSIGRGIREFREAASEIGKKISLDDDENETEQQGTVRK